MIAHLSCFFRALRETDLKKDFLSDMLNLRGVC